MNVDIENDLAARERIAHRNVHTSGNTYDRLGIVWSRAVADVRCVRHSMPNRRPPDGLNRVTSRGETVWCVSALVSARRPVNWV